MNYNTFGNEVKQEEEKLLGTEVRVELRQITKKQRDHTDGSVFSKGLYVSPTIYLEEFTGVQERHEPERSLPEFVKSL